MSNVKVQMTNEKGGRLRLRLRERKCFSAALKKEKDV